MIAKSPAQGTRPAQPVEIELEIDSLVLTGFAALDTQAVIQALGQELASLIKEQNLTVQQLQPATMELTVRNASGLSQSAGAMAIGRALANAIIQDLYKGEKA